MADLRQWCGECQVATVTWIDPYGVSRCSGHESENAWYDEDDEDDEGDDEFECWFGDDDD